MRPLGLDLYSGAGGASKGYVNAGFEMMGVDKVPMPNYPWYFVQADALEVLETLVAGNHFMVYGKYDGYPYWPKLSDFTFIHASPPCQRYSMASQCRPGLAEKYPDLIGPTRELLRQTGLPYVIENVPGSPLIDPVELCGCQFGCQTYWPGKGIVGLRRPRLFETNFPVPQPMEHNHEGITTLSVFGHGAPGNRPDLAGPGYAKAAQEVMQINWMTRDEINEAIPPAFTEYVGAYLRVYLDKEAA